MDYTVVSFYDGLVVLPLYGKSRNQNVMRSLHSVDIPAATEAIINVSIPKKFRSKTALLEPYTGNTSRPFLVAKTLVNIKRGQTVCHILNPSNDSCRIRKGSTVATVHDAVLFPSFGSNAVSNIDIAETTDNVSFDNKIKKLKNSALNFKKKTLMRPHTLIYVIYYMNLRTFLLPVLPT